MLTNKAARTLEELKEIEQAMDTLSTKIQARASQLNADVVTTRSDPVISDLWRDLCRHHRKAVVLCTGMGMDKPEMCVKLEKPRACIEALHLSEEETCCAVFKRMIQARTGAARKVKDQMSSPAVTIGADETIEAALSLMRKHDVGSLIVMEKGEIKGILTEGDLISKIFNRATQPSEKIFVKQIMTSAPVVTIDQEADMMTAAALMAKHNVRHLPVTEGGTLVGMLAIRDFYQEVS